LSAIYDIFAKNSFGRIDFYFLCQLHSAVEVGELFVLGCLATWSEEFL